MLVLFKRELNQKCPLAEGGQGAPTRRGGAGDPGGDTEPRPAKQRRRPRRLCRRDVPLFGQAL